MYIFGSSLNQSHSTVYPIDDPPAGQLSGADDAEETDKIDQISEADPNSYDPFLSTASFLLAKSAPVYRVQYPYCFDLPFS